MSFSAHLGVYLMCIYIVYVWWMFDYMLDLGHFPEEFTWKDPIIIMIPMITILFEIPYWIIYLCFW